MADTTKIEDKTERKKLKRAARKKAAPKAKRTAPRGSNKKKVKKLARGQSKRYRTTSRRSDSGLAYSQAGVPSDRGPENRSSFVGMRDRSSSLGWKCRSGVFVFPPSFSTSNLSQFPTHFRTRNSLASSSNLIVYTAA